MPLVVKKQQGFTPGKRGVLPQISLFPFVFPVAIPIVTVPLFQKCCAKGQN
ncbi:MAG: hypothetical protein RLZZ253_715 [Verrucomicrobiota bacterium]